MYSNLSKKHTQQNNEMLQQTMKEKCGKNVYPKNCCSKTNTKLLCGPKQKIGVVGLPSTQLLLYFFV